jgi:hypothetical protein
MVASPGAAGTLLLASAAALGLLFGLYYAAATRIARFCRRS